MADDTQQDESNDLPATQQAEEQTEKADKKSDPKAGKSSSGGAWLATFCLFLLVALAGVGGWYGWQLYQQVEKVQSQLAGTERQLPEPFDPAPLERQLADLYEKVNALADRADARSDQTRVDPQVVESLARQLASMQSRLEAMSDTSRDDWKLAEAAFLLRLANQKVLVEHNSGEALALTRAADEILKAQDDPELFAVRQVLAREMTELRMVEPVDKEGVYARLQAIIDKIDTLPLLDSYERELPAAAAGSDAGVEPAGTWARVKASLRNAARTLGSLIRVRRHGESVEPMLAPEQTYFLRQNLRLKLEQAQSALLTERAGVYHQSLDRAQQWLGDYFSLSGQAAAIGEELEQLQGVDIRVELPDISEAQRLLRQYIERLHKVEPEDPS